MAKEVEVYSEGSQYKVELAEPPSKPWWPGQGPQAEQEPASALRALFRRLKVQQLKEVTYGMALLWAALSTPGFLCGTPALGPSPSSLSTSLSF